MEENIDFSGAFEKVKEMLSDADGQEQIQNILSMFTGGQNNDSSAENTATNLPSLLSEKLFSGDNSENSMDFDMIFKLQKIMSLMKDCKNSPQTDFLLSLKPFLKSKRQTRVEQAAKLINAIKVIKMFKAIDGGGD